MPDPTVPTWWVDAAGAQQGPTTFDQVVQWARAGQLPPTTAVWWDGAADWMPLAQVDGVELGAAAPAPPPPAADAPPPPAADAAPVSASAALMSGLTDQELDDEFMGLIGRSWEMYKETELATSIDEAMLGGVIAALVDCGFVLIDLETAGGRFGVVAADPTAGAAVGSTPTSAHHQLRFEEPETKARVTVALEHLTPDVASAKMIGHRAAAILGYGERVKEFQKVSQAVRQEMASSFIVSPEPGTVTFDADLSSGYVYAQVDLLLELDRYVDDGLDVDHDLLRRHLASVVYTMKTFVQARFGG